MGNGGCGYFELDLFRSWQLRRDGEVVHVAARQQRLIAALAVRGSCLRTYLAGMLWPEHPDPKALESLRVSVHLVSRQLPGLLIKNGAMLALSGQVKVDLHRVRALLQGNDVAGNGNAAAMVRDLRGAEFLPGWYEDWVLFEQGRLRHDRLRAFTGISRALMSRGDFEGAADAASAALDIEPLYESAVRTLIRAELQLGNTASALLAYQTYRLKLQEEMGVLPSESLRSLIDEVQESRGRPVQQVLEPPGVPVSVLGRQPLMHNL